MNHRNAARWFGILDQQSQNYVVMACKGLKITFLEYTLLLNLYQNEGISQDGMAKILLVDKAVVTRTIKLLEEKGLVWRRQSETDKRSKNVYFTPLGKAQEAFLVAVLQKWIDFLCEGMENKAMEVFLDGLQRIAAKAAQADFNKI